MPPRKRRVVLGFLGTTLDSGAKAQRWSRWRPTISMCRHPDLPIDRVELWHGPDAGPVLTQVTADLAEVAPATRVVPHLLTIRDPWDFEEVFAALHDFARTYRFDPDREEYLVHITTGTHVGQICLFLLVESRRLPARLLQTSPGARGAATPTERSAWPAASTAMTLPRPSTHIQLPSAFCAARGRSRTTRKPGTPW